jgi:glycosyltransferase involved in cell wall biosynthesis
MKICIVGGIFDKPLDYREKLAFTPETVLASGLSLRGFEVTTVGHRFFQPSEQFDIVHVHHLGKGALRMAATSGSRSRFVFTTHNGPILCGCEKSLARNVAFRYVVNRSDAVVALCEAEAKLLCQMGNGPTRIEVIPNGTPSDVFRPLSHLDGKREPSHRILFVGQLVPLKGVHILLQALKELRGSWPLELLLVYQTNHLAQHCRRFARKLGVADQVKFLGFLSVTELATTYRNVDMVVLPSFAECLPSVITESLLSGTPVVATRVGGVPEQVGPFGELANPGDVKELTSAIERLLIRFPYFAASAHEMRAHAMKRFSVENMIDAHIRLYQDLLKRCGTERNWKARMIDHAVKGLIRVDH